jgi:hypothetical protein
MLRLGRLSTASRTSVLVLGEFENDALHGRGGIALNGGDALAKWKSRCFAQIRDLSERMRVAGKTMEDLDADYTSRGSKPVADVRAPAFEYPKEAIVSYAQTRTFFYGAPCITYNPAFMLTLELTILPTCRLHGHFYDHGWRDINVEPNSSYAEKLRKERPRDATLEVALGDSTGTATLYEFGSTGLSTLVEEIAAGHTAAGFEAAERRVPITTLAAIFAFHPQSMQQGDQT